MPLVRCRRPTPSSLPAHTSPRIVRPPFDSAGRVGVQPAAQLRHVRRHNHVRHVRGALRACSIAPPNLHRRALSPCMPLVCTAAGPHPPASRPTPRPASYALLSTRQGASAFNQPLSFDTSSVTTMYHMFSVRSTHALAPPNLHRRPLFPCMPL
eukprot:scaffold44095_cov50-Phaeocystis_antarctica.AAC.2